MEFPTLGKHCDESSCKQLDFLPMKCDACHKIFCNDHIFYESHNCTEAYKKDNQVPVCPLCNIPIPVKPGETPDIKVGQHIDTDCQSDPAKEKRKIFTNRCSKKGCKTKELIPFKCEKCHANYCLKHRNELDHNCAGFMDSGKGMSSTGAAAMSRLSSSHKSKSAPKSQGAPQHTMLSSIGSELNRERQNRNAIPSRSAGTSINQIQGNMTEDEAMARALAMSMADSTSSQSRTTSQTDEQKRQEEEDLALARALATSEQEARSTPNQAAEQKDRSCHIS